jgi:uncharacterized protein
MECNVMTLTKEAATEFLTLKRVAVTGVSAHPSGHGSNVVYTRMRECGYEVFPVNPNQPVAEGDQTYPDLHAIPGGVDSVVIGTRPERAEATMREAIDLGITHVWMHRSYGSGSVSDEATALGREHGVTVIDGGCPLMYGQTSDGGHRAMCRVLTALGKVPRKV